MGPSHRTWNLPTVSGLAALLVLAAGTAWAAGPLNDPPSQNEPGELEPPRPERPGIRDTGPPRGWPEEPLFEPRTEEEWRPIREFLEVHFPQWARELERLREANRRMFRRKVREILPRVLQLMRELDEDEELGMLGIKQEQLALRIRRASRQCFDAEDQAEQQRFRDKLRRLIEEQFDVRQRRRERMIGKLEARLERMKRHTQRQAGNREQIVARELEQILDPFEPPEPGPGPGRHGGRRGPGHERPGR